ncbi:MAG: ABC transporter substrate-binding protein [bacterium]
MFKKEAKTYSRREFLKIAGIAGAAASVGAGLGGLVAACGEETGTATTAGATTTTAGATTTATAGSTTTVSTGPEAGRDLKIGVISPETGALAPFAVGVNWTIGRVDEYLKDGIVCSDGKQRKLQLIKRDTQSDSNRSAQVTADLIQLDSVDIVLSSGAPDTTSPSADTCEALGCPSLSSAGPWQAFFFDRKPPAEGFKWTYGVLLGSEQTILCFSEMFDQIPNNKVVAMLFANDADAAGWMAENAAPAVFEAKGYTLVVPTWYTPGAEDFTAQISEFKKAGCEILCGTNTPPDFTNFWKQSIQQGFHPKLASSGKALLFPETLNAIGEVGQGLLGEVGWHRTFPYLDTLTGQTAEELAQDFETKTGMVACTNSTGMYQLAEWAVDVLKRAASPEDKESVVEAIRTTNMTTTNGPLDFTQPMDMMGWHPVPNCVKSVLCGGQWVKGEKYPFEVAICSNAQAPDVKVQDKVQPMAYS